jgi:hypothetical protein
MEYTIKTTKEIKKDKHLFDSAKWIFFSEDVKDMINYKQNTKKVLEKFLYVCSDSGCDFNKKDLFKELGI